MSENRLANPVFELTMQPDLTKPIVMNVIPVNERFSQAFIELSPDKAEHLASALLNAAAVARAGVHALRETMP